MLPSSTERKLLERQSIIKASIDKIPTICLHCGGKFKAKNKFTRLCNRCKAMNKFQDADWALL